MGKKRGMTPTAHRTWVVWLSVAHTNFKTPVLGALNGKKKKKMVHPDATNCPRLQFSFLQNCTIYWLKSCREENKGCILLHNNSYADCPHFGRMVGGCDHPLWDHT